MKRSFKNAAGFTFLEALFAIAIFVIVAGAAFSLLSVAQQRYQTDSQVLNAFQEARMGMDQMIQDFATAGYPPQSLFSYTSNSGACTAIAWYPNYTCPSQSNQANPYCYIASNCSTPTNFDMILETSADAAPGSNTVQWIHYQLTGTSLLRGVASKSSTTGTFGFGRRGGTTSDPLSTTAGDMEPFVQNVMNNASPAQIAAINAVSPGTFPGGAPVPVFSYSCNVAGNFAGGSPMPCTSANTPLDITDVDITLVVQAPQVDAQTGQVRVSVLHGRGRLLNLTP